MKTGRKPTKPKEEKKECSNCKKDKVITNFYNTNNKLLNGKSPYCKPCTKQLVDENNIDSVHEMLRALDIPFILERWELAKNSTEDSFGSYVRMINSLPQYRGLTWQNSIFERKNKDAPVITGGEQQPFHFSITPEIVMRWGQNHETDDYIKLEDFYHKMKSMNKIETPQEETYLKKLAMISVKMDQELEEGNYGQVKQLGDLFSKYMGDSKFRAMDKTDADKTGGIRSFGAIFAEVESDGHIPPWEEYRKIKGLTQDLVDKTIMHIENFTLRLNKIERMVEPPSDTPKIEDGDI